MENDDAIDRLNAKAYSSNTARKFYDRRGQLYPPERLIFDRLRPLLTGKRLLDIGVGGGRTTPFLLEISRDYSAIDYSPPLVDAVKRKYGIRSAYVCDVRNMTVLTDAAFDFVLFSFSGLDCVDHAGRMKALREIHRVLKPGGLFLFSSHNRNSPDVGKRPWQSSQRRFSWSLIKQSAWALLFLPRHWRMRRFEMRTAEYAILNDGGLRYLSMCYYVTPQTQLTQLEQVGFSSVELFDLDGYLSAADTTTPWVHYLVRKPLT